MSSTTHTGPVNAGTVEWGCEPLRYLSHVILRFLRAVFETAPKDLYYFNENDPDASRVMITGDIPVSGEAVGVRPHIVPFFSGVQWQGVSLDQLSSEELFSGNRRHTDLISGNLTISVLARNGSEATFIAFHIANFTWILRRLLMRAKFHDIGQRMFISPPTSPGQLVTNDLDGEIISVNATTQFSFKWDVGVQESGMHLLESIELQLETTREPVVGGQNEIPVGIIGSAVSTVEGERPTMRYSTQRSGYPDITDRKRYVVTTSFDETPITRTIKIGEE